MRVVALERPLPRHPLDIAHVIFAYPSPSHPVCMPNVLSRQEFRAACSSKMAQSICRPFSVAPCSRAGLARRAPLHASAPTPPCRVCAAKPAGAFGDVIAIWLDLAQFVSGNPDLHTPYDDLAKKIGDEVFMDFNGWHLYLKDVKVAGSVSLAQSLAYQLGSGQTDLKDLLFRVPIQVGGGKVTLSLQEALPLPCVEALARIVNDWAAGKK